MLSKSNGTMPDNVAACCWNSLKYCISDTDDCEPAAIMQVGDRKILKVSVNGDTAVDTGCTAKKGLLQTLQLSKRASCCISWGPDSPAIRGTMLQDGLLQPDQHLYRFCRLQTRIPREV